MGQQYMNGRKNRTPGSIGGENLTRLAVSAALLTLAACGGGGGSDTANTQEPTNLQGVPDVAAANAGDVNANQSVIIEAKTDVAETAAGTPLVVSVLQNDSFAEDATMELVGQPANGTAVVLDNGDVEYTANVEFEGTDTVKYKIIDSEGRESLGTLYIAVVCADCAITPVASANPDGFAYCQGSNPDPDGDGYGWEDNASCVVPAIGAALDPLAAKADTLDIKAGEVKTVSPLRNDSIADRDNVQFAIDVQPIAGAILAAEAGVIVYQAPAEYSGTDSIVYSIKDKSGSTSVASIDFNVTCDSCVDYKGLRLSWPENPGAEGVEGYRVLFGADSNPLTSTVVSEVQVGDLEGVTPNVVFDLASDLNLTTSEGGCFMIKAYRGTEESEASEAACFSRG